MLILHTNEIRSLYRLSLWLSDNIWRGNLFNEMHSSKRIEINLWWIFADIGTTTGKHDISGVWIEMVHSYLIDQLALPSWDTPEDSLSTMTAIIWSDHVCRIYNIIHSGKRINGKRFKRSGNEMSLMKFNPSITKTSPDGRFFCKIGRLHL